MNYIPAKTFCSPQQIKNLQSLLTYLKDDKGRLTRFSMKYYGLHVNSNSKFLQMRSLEPVEVTNDCGTSCCLAGHGPLAGVLPELEEGWPEYISRVFVSFSENVSVYNFLFSASWAMVQPALDQAIFRLELFLTKGLPITFYPGGSRALVSESLFKTGREDFMEKAKIFDHHCDSNLHTLNLRKEFYEYLD